MIDTKCAGVQTHMLVLFRVDQPEEKGAYQANKPQPATAKLHCTNLIGITYKNAIHLIQQHEGLGIRV